LDQPVAVGHRRTGRVCRQRPAEEGRNERAGFVERHARGHDGIDRAEARNRCSFKSSGSLGRPRPFIVRGGA